MPITFPIFQYAIGDCGQPRQRGQCPCGAAIGGVNYAFADNGQNAQQRQQAQFKDSTKNGYLLGPADQMQAVYGIREMSRLEVVIIRFVLHASMYIGAQIEPNRVKQKISCQPKDLNAFLVGHLRQNLSQIAKSIGSNEETSQPLLHQVLNTMYTNRSPLDGAHEWGSKKSVKDWENFFAKEIIRPLVNNIVLEKDMKNLKIKFKEDMEGAKSAVLTVLEEEGESTKATSIWQPQFW